MYGDAWLPDLGDIFIAAEQSGFPLNADVNSGHPIGMGMGTICIHNGQRLTSSHIFNRIPLIFTVKPNYLH
jgi:hypothetical protein